MWQRVIGILGGLGPHAHIEFERRLLAAVENPAEDQEYPEWLVASMPETPDRTNALLYGGASPVPSLLRGLDRLAASAHFAVITCLTAHAFLAEIRPRAPLPILDVVELTLTHAGRRFDRGRIGVLATTGALKSGIYSRAAAGEAPNLEVVCLLDLPHGEELQEELVMRPIYGPLHGSRRVAGGIKGGCEQDPETGIPHREMLTRAVSALVQEGVQCVVTGCTEIPLALGRLPIEGIPLLDPLELAAHAALAIARGERPLPPAGKK